MLIDYDEMRPYFSSEYDRSNPITKEEATNEYLEYIKMRANNDAGKLAQLQNAFVFNQQGQIQNNARYNPVSRPLAGGYLSALGGAFAPHNAGFQGANAFTASGGFGGIHPTVPGAPNQQLIGLLPINDPSRISPIMPPMAGPPGYQQPGQLQKPSQDWNLSAQPPMPQIPLMGQSNFNNGPPTQPINNYGPPPQYNQNQVFPAPSQAVGMKPGQGSKRFAGY